MRHKLTEFEWAAIRSFLPNKPRGIPRVDDRRVLNGIFWVLRSSARWSEGSCKLSHLGSYQISISEISAQAVRVGQGPFAPNADLLRWIKLIPPVQSPPLKIFPFAPDPNHFHIPRCPVPQRGAFRDRHGRWNGMRWTRAAL